MNVSTSPADNPNFLDALSHVLFQVAKKSDAKTFDEAYSVMLPTLKNAGCSFYDIPDNFWKQLNDKLREELGVK